MLLDPFFQLIRGDRMNRIPGIDLAELKRIRMAMRVLLCWFLFGWFLFGYSSFPSLDGVSALLARIYGGTAGLMFPFFLLAEVLVIRPAYFLKARFNKH